MIKKNQGCGVSIEPNLLEQVLVFGLPRLRCCWAFLRDLIKKKKDYGRQKQILTPKNFTGNTKRLNILTMEIDFERNFRSIYFMPALVTLTQTWSFILQSNSFSLLTATDLI